MRGLKISCLFGKILLHPFNCFAKVVDILHGVESAVGGLIVHQQLGGHTVLTKGVEHLFGLLQGTAEVVLVLYEQGGGWCTCWRT